MCGFNTQSLTGFPTHHSLFVPCWGKRLGKEISALLKRLFRRHAASSARPRIVPRDDWPGSQPPGGRRVRSTSGRAAARFHGSCSSAVTEPTAATAPCLAVASAQARQQPSCTPHDPPPSGGDAAVQRHEPARTRALGHLLFLGARVLRGHARSSAVCRRAIG